MAKDMAGRQSQLRQMIAQEAARMMAEEGISDFAYAKKKAGRKLNVQEASYLPSNSEIESEIRLYQQLYQGDSQPEMLKILREDALKVMQIFARFDPLLTGSVLEGTAGMHAEIHIHLFADSAKEVEIFLLNQQIPYDSDEKSYRIRDKSDKKNSDRMKVPVFTLETQHGLVKLSVFDYDAKRITPKSPVQGSQIDRVSIEGLKLLLEQEERMI
jgi:hypothetical protein